MWEGGIVVGRVGGRGGRAGDRGKIGEGDLVHFCAANGAAWHHGILTGTAPACYNTLSDFPGRSLSVQWARWDRVAGKEGQRWRLLREVGRGASWAVGGEGRVWSDTHTGTQHSNVACAS
ncbi:hypothetical protein Bbelb_256990 [Branchiostoma belcheri]|nr:hypothetical protein Bbelb_256990 [Branchiostoma belcheri]